MRSSAKPKILIVDNNLSNRTRLKEIVQDTFDVCEAEDGASALKILAKDNEFEIAIVEIDILSAVSAIDGFELLQNIKSHNDLKHISVITITEVGAEANEEKALNLGAADFICKPFNANIVKQRIQNVYNRKCIQHSDLVQEASKRMGVLFNTIPGGICVFKYINKKIALIYKNEKIHNLAGYTEDEFENITNDDMLNIVYEGDKQSFVAEIEKSANECKSLDVKLRWITRKATITWIHMVASIVIDADGMAVFYGVCTDINKEKFNEERTNAALKALKYRSEHDMLTGIYNRDSFNRATAEMLEKNPDTQFVLMRTDVEKFKVINDIYGTEVGDQVLIAIAKKLDEELHDIGTYGRLEADVFVMAFPSKFLQFEDVSKLFTSCFYGLNINCKIILKTGVYYIDDITLPVEQMCDRASLAAHTIKGNCLQDFAVYDDKLRDSILREQDIVSDMNKALVDEQFVMYLQPIFSISEGKAVGAEALVRWLHPTKGLIMPSVFIPLFEKNGFIVKLDKYMLIKACKLIKEMEKRNDEVLPISVNLSRLDFLIPDIAEQIIEIVKGHEVDPKYIKLEITESAYMETPKDLLIIMKKLQSYGFKILMDDFGSGYSSLNMLKNIEVDVLKIDLQFLEGFEKSSRSASILTSIVRMAKWLDMPIIAEGVETQTEVDFLKSIGCDCMQGYWFSPPMPIEEFYLRKNQIIKEKDTAEILENNDLSEMFETSFLSNKIFNSVFGGIVIFELVNDNLELLRVNEGYYDLMKYNPQTLFDNNKKFLNYVHKEDREPVVAACKKAISSRQTQHIAIRKYRTDHTLLWLDVKISYLGGTQQRPIVVLTFIDITSQKNMEQERYLNRFNIAMRKAYAEIFEIDLDKMTTKSLVPYAPNDASAQNNEPIDYRLAITNFAKRMVNNDCKTEFLKFTDPQFMLHNCVDTDENNAIEVLCALDGGKEIWLEISMIYIEERKFLCCLKDIDAKKKLELNKKELIIEQTQKRIATSHSNILSLLSYIPAGILKYRASEDSDEIVFANENMLKLLQCSREDLSSHYGDKFINLVAQEDRSRILKSIKKQVTLKNKDEIEYRLARKDGTYLDVFDVAEMITDENGEKWFYAIVYERTNQARFFESVINNMPQGIAVFRIGSTIEPLYLSNALIMSLGYSLQEGNDFAERNNFSAFNIQLSEVDTDLYKYYKSEEVFEYLLHTKNKAGLPICLKIIGKFAKYSSNEKLGYATVMDFTEQELVIKNEAIQNRRNKQITDNLKNATFEYDIASDTAHCSIYIDKTNEHKDWVLKNFMASFPQTDIVYIADRIPFLLWLKKFLTTQKCDSLDVRLNFTNKSYRWYQCDVYNITNDKNETIQIVGSFRDINVEKTVKLHSEDALDVFCSAINSDGISLARICWGKEMEIVFANDLYYKLRGCTRENAPALADTFITQEERIRVTKFIADSINNGKKYLTYETCVRDVNNQTKYLLRCASVQFIGVKTYIDCIDCDITDKIYLLTASKIDNQIYKLVTENSDTILFEFNFKDHILYYSYLTEQGIREQRIVNNFHYEFVDCGILSPEDYDLFGKAIFAHIEKPQLQDTVFDFKWRIVEGSSRWYRATIKSFVDKENNGCRIVGRCDNIENIKQLETEYNNSLNYKMTLLDSCLYCFEFYLDSNSIEIVLDNTQKVANLENAENYIIPKQGLSHIYFEDLDIVAKLMNGKELLSKYKDGKTIEEYDFRLITKDNNLYWVRAEQNIVLDKNNNKYKCFTVVKSLLDDTIFSENKLLALQDIDPLTSLLTRKAIMTALQKRFVNTTRANYAFIIIEIDNYREIVNNLGVDSGEKILTQAGYFIQSTFGNNELIARLDGERFGIALAFKEYGDEEIKKRVVSLQSGLKSLPNILENKMTIGISVGVAFTRYPSVYSYDALSANALEQLKIAKTKTKNKISYMEKKDK